MHNIVIMSTPSFPLAGVNLVSGGRSGLFKLSNAASTAGIPDSDVVVNTQLQRSSGMHAGTACCWDISADHRREQRGSDKDRGSDGGCRRSRGRTVGDGVNLDISIRWGM